MLSRIFRRSYKVLAIESSCDDSCVTLLDRFSKYEPPKIVFEGKRTLDSKSAGGVVPTEAARHNGREIAGLANEAIQESGWTRPDVVCATRGPGMVGSLSAGYQLALGMAVAWQVPLVGVNHMLGHLLMSRMDSNGREPQYPFLSLLVSGGHTMCVLSRSLTDHEILVDTLDIAAGDALDKCGRELGIRGNMIGKEMEKFLEEHRDQWDQDVEIALKEPMQNASDRRDVLQYSFAAYISMLRASVKKFHGGVMPTDTNTVARMAYRIETSIFQHMITKVKLAIKKKQLEGVKDFVCSGGVGSNLTLRKMLKDQLEPLGVENFYFPPPKYCTDNATMIGWAGIELYEHGYTTELETNVTRKWPLPELLDLYGWKHQMN